MTTCFGKELFIRFTASAFRKLLSVYVFSYFPFGFEGRMGGLIVSVSDHCLPFYFTVINLSISPECISNVTKLYFKHEEPLCSWLPMERTAKTDQTGRTPRLIWVFVRRTCQSVGFLMLRLIEWYHTYGLWFQSVKLSQKISATIRVLSGPCAYGLQWLIQKGFWGSNEPSLELKLFHLHGKFQEKLVKLHKSTPHS